MIHDLITEVNRLTFPGAIGLGIAAAAAHFGSIACASFFVGFVRVFFPRKGRR